MKKRVPAYICRMRLEDAIKSSRFGGEKQKAAVNVLYTANWLRSNYSNALKKEDITMEQYNIMRILKGKHPEQMCVKDMASRMIEKSSNVPRIIDRLVIKKLAKRTPSKEDKRETLVSLTDRGMAVLERANLLINAVEDDIKVMSEDEAKLLNDLLEKMREASGV
jgi:DNA-binding MarR family transcriptional regulator